MKKKRRFHYTVCGLRFDNHYKACKPCYGEIMVLGGIPLCARHRGLVEAIKRDANREKRRHPVRHRGSQAA